MITSERLTEIHDEVTALSARRDCLEELLGIVIAEGNKSASNADTVEARIWLKVAQIISEKCDENCDQSGKLLAELKGDEA